MKRKNAPICFRVDPLSEGAWCAIKQSGPKETSLGGNRVSPKQGHTSVLAFAQSLFRALSIARDSSFL